MTAVPVTFDLDDLAERLRSAVDRSDDLDVETVTVDRVTWVMAASLVDAHRKLQADYERLLGVLQNVDGMVRSGFGRDDIVRFITAAMREVGS